MGMKVYKFKMKGGFIRVIAEDILKARKVVERNHKGAKFVTIEKVILWKEGNCI